MVFPLSQSKVVAELRLKLSLLTSVLSTTIHSFQSSISSLASWGLTGILLWKELQSETWSTSQFSLVTCPSVRSLCFLSTYLGVKNRFQGVTWLMAGYFSSWARGWGSLSWFWLPRHSESLVGVSPVSQKVPQGPQSRIFVYMEGWEEWRGLYWGLPLNSHGSDVLRRNIRRQKCLLFLAGGHSQPQGWWQ